MQGRVLYMRRSQVVTDHRFHCQDCGIWVSDDPSPVIHGYLCFDCWRDQIARIDERVEPGVGILRGCVLALLAAAFFAAAYALVSVADAQPSTEAIKPQSVNELDWAVAHGMNCARQGGEYVCR